MRGLNLLRAGLLVAILVPATVAAAADDPRSPTVEVTVVDEADRPVAGASVRFLERSGDDPIAETGANGDLQRRPQAAPIEDRGRRLLTGSVIAPDGSPIASARIHGIYPRTTIETQNSRTLFLVADAAGKFETPRFLSPLWLFATSPDGKLAGRLTVEAEQQSVDFKLTPAAAAVGRLIDGELALGGVSVDLRLSLEIPDGNRVQRIGLGMETFTTAADGRFVVPGLIIGEEYRLNFGGQSRNIRGSQRVKAGKPGLIDLGFIEAPGRRESTIDGLTWMHLDVAARLSSRFEVKTDLATRISQASADAKRENRRVLLVIGDPEASATRSAFEILDGIVGAEDFEFQQRKFKAAREGEPDPEADVKRAMADFVRVHIAADPRATALLARNYRLDLARVAWPALVILGEEGRVAALRWFGTADEPPQVNADALRDFVKSHALPARNAEELLAEALRRARDEKKRVFLLQSGSDSYPSRMLGRFIERHRALFDRDYVYLDLDPYRTTKGDDVIRRFRPAAGTLPWMAILDADGKKLVDSDSSDGNIGFPAESEAINWFIDGMLKPTARDMPPAELETLRSALRGK